jgi:hypothetical protein
LDLNLPLLTGTKYAKLGFPEKAYNIL